MAQPGVRKKRRSQSRILSSDSEEESSVGDNVNLHESLPDDEKQGTGNRRTSRRLFEKGKKPKFKRLSRDEIWDKIPSLRTPEKLSRITPRKSVNNFIKGYHIYNYDDYEDTGDEEDIIGSGTSSESESGKVKHRIRNYHTRICAQESSSENDEDNDKQCKKTSASNEGVSAEVESAKDTESKSAAPKSEKINTNKRFSPPPVSCRNKRSVLVLESDSSSDEREGSKDLGNKEESEDEKEASSNSSSGDGDESNSDFQSGSESSSEPEENLESSGRAARLKEKQHTAFSEFKRALERKRSRQSTSSNSEQPT